MSNNSSLSRPRDTHKRWWLIWVTLGVSVVSIIIAIWSIVLSNVTIDCKSLEFSYDALGTIIGIILSSVALVVSLFFIILGIGATSIRREIKEDAKEARSAVVDSINTIQDEKNSELKGLKYDIILQFYELYSDVIDMTSRFYNSTNLDGGCYILHGCDCNQKIAIKDQMTKRNDELKLAQARFVCKNIQNLVIEDKIINIVTSGINMVMDLGVDQSDLDLLKDVENTTENNIVKEVAHHAYGELKKKLLSETTLRMIKK